MLRLSRLAVVLGLAFLVACTTPPPVAPPEVPPVVAPVVPPVIKPTEPEPSPVLAAVQEYQSVADAPKVLEALNKTLEERGKDLATLSPADQSLYANLLLASNDYDRAATVFEHLLGQDPANKDALTTLALLAGVKGNVAAQKDYLGRLATHYPNDPEVLNLKGQNLFAAGDAAGARTAWEASLAGGDNPDALVGLSLLALQTKKPKDAIVLLDRAELLTKQNDLLYSLRAQARSVMGEDQKAFADLTSATNLRPDNAWYWLDRARLGWLKLSRPVQALGDAERALALDPGLFYAWQYRAEILETQGRAQEAYESYRRALALETDFRYSLPALATLAFRFRDFPQAQRYAREAAKDYPGEYAFPVIEALSLRFLGKPAEAQQVLEKNQSRFPRGTTVNELYRFLLNPGADFSLNVALTQEKKENIKVRVQFYQACQYLHDKAYSSARATFSLASESRLPGIPEIAAAKDWLDHGF